MSLAGAPLPIASLPVVIVPVGTDEDALDAWLATFAADEQEFRRERKEILLYPEEKSSSK